MPTLKKTVRFNDAIQEFILPEQEDSDYESSYGNSNEQDLIDAVIDQNNEAVKSILSQGDEDFKIDDIVVEIQIEDSKEIIDSSLLDIAISNYNFETAKMLINHGARIISSKVRAESQNTDFIKKIDDYIYQIDRTLSKATQSLAKKIVRSHSR